MHTSAGTSVLDLPFPDGHHPAERMSSITFMASVGKPRSYMICNSLSRSMADASAAHWGSHLDPASCCSDCLILGVLSGCGSSGPGETKLMSWGFLRYDSMSMCWVFMWHVSAVPPEQNGVLNCWPRWFTPLLPSFWIAVIQRVRSVCHLRLSRCTFL
ncbi:hypothetical protein WJX82_002780 [Trebouxia sp. C0006]